MAKQIVTQELVDRAAENALANGIEPSIVAVQAQIGAGSYSTVQKYLAVWKQRQVEAAAVSSDMPADIESKGQAFVRSLWAIAAQQTKADAQVKVDQAHAETAAARKQLSEATVEIARLETAQVEQAEIVEQQRVRIREIELALAEAQTEVRRVVAVEQALAETRLALEAARKDATDKAVAAGKLTGEVETLRSQNRDLMATLGKPKSGK